MVDIRWVSADDWEVWRDLRLRALATDPDAFGSVLADWSDADETRWRAGFGETLRRAIAVVDGRPAGMIGCREGAANSTPGTAPAVEIVSVWVAPSARGLGAGDALISAIVSWAARHRPGHQVLLHVRTGNEAAIGLYRRSGFVDDGPAPSRLPDGPPERRLVRRS